MRVVGLHTCLFGALPLRAAIAVSRDVFRWDGIYPHRAAHANAKFVRLPLIFLCAVISLMLL